MSQYILVLRLHGHMAHIWATLSKNVDLINMHEVAMSSLLRETGTLYTALFIFGHSLKTTPKPLLHSSCSICVYSTQKHDLKSERN